MTGPFAPLFSIDWWAVGGVVLLAVVVGVGIVVAWRRRQAAYEDGAE